MRYLSLVYESFQMMENINLPSIWRSFTIKAFCKQCDHFDLVVDGDFLKLAHHLVFHETILKEEVLESKEFLDLKNEDTEWTDDPATLSSVKEPFIIPILLKTEETSPCKKTAKSQNKKSEAKKEKFREEVVEYENTTLQKRRRIRRTVAEIEQDSVLESSDDEDDCGNDDGQEEAEIKWDTVYKEIHFSWDSIWDHWCLDTSRKVWKCNYCVHEYPDKETKKHKSHLKRACVLHTKKFHYNMISEAEKESLISAKMRKRMVFRKIRKDYNLALRGPVADLETGELMHIRKFMSKLYAKKKEENSFTSVFKNFTKDLIEPNTYICNLCNSEVRTSKNHGHVKPAKFYEHMQNVHDQFKDVKRHLCQECGEVYMSEASLDLHVMLKHTKFRYFCPFEHCKKGFHVKGEAMEQHIRTHTGEKPHLCTICGESFNSKQDLRYHVAMHKGESKFVCKYCQRPFLKSIQLKNHERTHTGERPFKCQECGKCFVQKIHLKTHMKGVHKM